MLARLDNADTDAGPRDAAGTLRLCVVTREVKPTDEMIRFVLGPDRAIVPDLKRKLPGRGAWVTARRDYLAAAAKRGALARVFGTDAKIAADLPAMVEQLIARSLLDALAISRKARQLILGYAQVESAAEEGVAVGFLQASDAGAEGARQIMAAIRRGYGADAAKIAVIRAFTTAQLDLALARPNVVHAALLAGRASETVLKRWQMLARVRIADPNGSTAMRPDPEASKSGLE